MSSFRWTKNRERAALALAHGATQPEAATEAKVSVRTITRWLNYVEFAAEVDRLTLLVSIASRAARLRIAMRVVQQKVRAEGVDTNKDLLDWLKYAQSETDGAKLDLTAVFTAMEGEAAGGDETE